MNRWDYSDTSVPYVILPELQRPQLTLPHSIGLSPVPHPLCSLTCTY